jgi:hypothetical protein
MTLMGVLIVHSSPRSAALARHVLAPLAILVTFLAVFTRRPERGLALAMATGALRSASTSRSDEFWRFSQKRPSGGRDSPSMRPNTTISGLVFR